MDKDTANWIAEQMQRELSTRQLRLLREVMELAIARNETSDDIDAVGLFLSAKEVEGCSPKTIAYYESTLNRMIKELAIPATKITTSDIRNYLAAYEAKRGSCKTTIDNIRRIIASFFAWLEDEDFIVKSPARRIRHVKQPKLVKGVFTDEELETLRDGCKNARDLAIVDLLASTGMRVGELASLNRSDIDFTERECIVTGKGNKQRVAYFDARTKLHLQAYLAERTDDCPALLVAIRGDAKRLSVGAIELRLRNLGKSSSVKRVHPHKFRRTLATSAIDKGMPIEQVQKLLGHEKIETTMHYALVSQSNVKTSHRKYLE